MTIGASIFLIALGAVLAFAVDVSTSGIDLNTIGVILMVVGVIGLAVGMLILNGGGFYGGPRRRSVVEDAYVDEPVVASRRRVVWRHLLPNISGTILAQASLSAANAIVVIAALSFIGIGASPTDPSWGSMIRTGGQQMATGQWWVALGPGLAVFLTVLSFNAIADGVMRVMEDR